MTANGPSDDTKAFMVAINRIAPGSAVYGTSPKGVKIDSSKFSDKGKYNALKKLFDGIMPPISEMMGTNPELTVFEDAINQVMKKDDFQKALKENLAPVPQNPPVAQAQPLPAQNSKSQPAAVEPPVVVAASVPTQTKQSNTTDNNQNNLQNDLFAAIKNNDLEKFKGILAKLDSAQFKDELQLTPLHYAAQLGNVLMMKDLIAKGAKVNEPSGKQGENTLPLHRAIASGRLDAVQVLIEAGADPRSKQVGANFPSPAEFALNLAGRSAPLSPEYTKIAQTLDAVPLKEQRSFPQRMKSPLENPNRVTSRQAMNDPPKPAAAGTTVQPQPIQGQSNPPVQSKPAVTQVPPVPPVQTQPLVAASGKIKWDTISRASSSGPQEDSGCRIDEKDTQKIGAMLNFLKENNIKAEVVDETRFSFKYKFIVFDTSKIDADPKLVEQYNNILNPPRENQIETLFEVVTPPYTPQASADPLPTPVVVDPRGQLKEIEQKIKAFTSEQMKECGLTEVDISKLDDKNNPTLRLGINCSQDQNEKIRNVYITPASADGGVVYSIEKSINPAENQKLLENAIRVAVEAAKPGTVLSIPAGADKKSEEALMKAMNEIYGKDKYKVENGKVTVPEKRPDQPTPVISVAKPS